MNLRIFLDLRGLMKDLLASLRLYFLGFDWTRCL
ncbi:protein of unknown function [Methylorubrum extorquens]|uniref:Uncharacterized protein n=1 Tax=Methylorubrum extorquens TaxID=408 RepID=A0A2N9AKN0_METEX|nr:protein of unknown function [Methylorubrum extorquens]